MKILTTQLLIFTLLVVSVCLPIFAQTQPVTVTNGPVPVEDADESPAPKKPDLKNVFGKKASELKDQSIFFDVKKAEKESRRQQPKTNNWSKRKTILVWVLVGIGAAVGIYFLAKYAKDCIKSDPPGCDPFYDEYCTCTEYAPRNK